MFLYVIQLENVKTTSLEKQLFNVNKLKQINAGWKPSAYNMNWYVGPKMYVWEGIISF